MGRYQPMGQLVQVREAGESRRNRALAMFEQGMTPLAVSKRLGLSHKAMIRLRAEWQREKAVEDFDPALAIGVYDHERPLPKSLIRFETRRAEPKKGPTKKQIAAAERAAVVLRSALDAATERALRERTPESRRAVLRLMGKGT